MHSYTHTTKSRGNSRYFSLNHNNKRLINLYIQWCARRPAHHLSSSQLTVCVASGASKWSVPAAPSPSHSAERVTSSPGGMSVYIHAQLSLSRSHAKCTWPSGAALSLSLYRGPVTLLSLYVWMDERMEEAKERVKNWMNEWTKTGGLFSLSVALDSLIV